MKHEKTHTIDEPFGWSQCDIMSWTTSPLIDEAWKSPHYGWTLWLLPVWLRVFNIKGFDWRGMKKSTLWDEPFSCSQCDFEFLTTSALIKEALKNHTMDETFGYSQCEFEFLTSRALIEEAWKNAHYGWTLWLLPVWLQVFNIKCFDWISMIKPTLGINTSAATSVASSFQHQVL